jgi:hypothetical protein
MCAHTDDSLGLCVFEAPNGCAISLLKNAVTLHTDHSCIALSATPRISGVCKGSGHEADALRACVAFGDCTSSSVRAWCALHGGSEISHNPHHDRVPEPPWVLAGLDLASCDFKEKQSLVSLSVCVLASSLTHRLARTMDE